MSQDKIKKLNIYVSRLKDKLTSPIPEKHRNHPIDYINFLNKEIETHTAKIKSLTEGPKV